MRRKALPRTGATWPELQQSMQQMSIGDAPWREGRVPLYVFRATEEVYDVGLKAFTEYFSENALGARRAFLGIGQMEREVIEIALDLFQAPDSADGVITSGGSESIVLAVKACRDWARALDRPEPFNLVLPFSAHPAFDKAADLMDLEVRRAPLAADLRADPDSLAALFDERTILLVGSAPCFSHGVIDPITALSALAAERDVWLHVDACVGGYLAPFVRDLGHPLPAFDFAVEGVRSLSADLHKFGFCPKPASTVLFRDEADARRAAPSSPSDGRMARSPPAPLPALGRGAPLPPPGPCCTIWVMTAIVKLPAD